MSQDVLCSNFVPVLVSPMRPIRLARTPVPTVTGNVAIHAFPLHVADLRPLDESCANITIMTVMLLGQAESGKSTLQKQFQLFYASKSLDSEKPSWRPIVFFNVIKAVRMILEELDFEFSGQAAIDDALATTQSLIVLGPHWPDEIARLRTKLLPLISIEDSLAAELSNGITVAGGRSGVFVRAGWQALVTPTRSYPISDARNSLSSTRAGVMATMAGRLLSDTQDFVLDLWHHPAVKALLRLRKLRLEESASL